MANVIVEHPDGRVFEVSEEVVKDHYEPAGFAVTGVVVDGVTKEPTKEHFKAANDHIAAVPDHATLVKESMARTDIQTNGISVADAYKAYGLPVPKGESAPVAPSKTKQEES